MECYIFDNQYICEQAADFINSDSMFPIAGNNIDKAKTERWAVPTERITDNKWYFPRIPQEFIDIQPQDMIDYFNNNYPNTIETFQKDWVKNDNT